MNNPSSDLGLTCRSVRWSRSQSVEAEHFPVTLLTPGSLSEYGQLVDWNHCFPPPPSNQSPYCRIKPREKIQESKQLFQRH